MINSGSATLDDDDDDYDVFVSSPTLLVYVNAYVSVYRNKVLICVSVAMFTSRYIYEHRSLTRDLLPK